MSKDTITILLAVTVVVTISIRGAYYCILEYKYLESQAREIGDVSILRWQRIFAVVAGALSAVTLAMFALAAYSVA